jgi:hypothetical protein
VRACARARLCVCVFVCSKIIEHKIQHEHDLAAPLILTVLSLSFLRRVVTLSGSFRSVRHSG